jgi:hypothetical protein
VTYLDSPDTLFVGQRAWYKTTKLVNNPAFAPGNGQPRLVHADNVGLSQATQGGLITASPADTAGANADALRGIQFVGPNGTPAPFNFGNISGVYSNGGSAEGSEGDVDHLAIPFRAFTFFGYGRYKLTSAISSSIELNYGKSFSETTALSPTSMAPSPYSATMPISTPQSEREWMRWASPAFPWAPAT